MAYTFGDLLNASWKSFQQNIGFYCVVALVLGFGAALVSLVGVTTTFEGFADEQYFLNGVTGTGSALDVLENITPVGWALYFLFLILNIVIGLAIPSFVYFHEVDEKRSFLHSLQYTVSKLWPLIVTSILYYFLMAILFLLLLIPGIIFGVFWCFFWLAVLFRGKSGFEAFKYSKSLVKDNWWRTFGYLLAMGVVLFLATFIVSVVVGIIIGVLSFVLPGVVSLAIEELFIQFISSLGGFFYLIFLTGYFLAREDEHESEKKA